MQKFFHKNSNFEIFYINFQLFVYRSTEILLSPGLLKDCIMQCLLHLRENQLMQRHVLGRQGHLRQHKEHINCTAVSVAWYRYYIQGTHVYTVLF